MPHPTLPPALQPDPARVARRRLLALPLAAVLPACGGGGGGGAGGGGDGGAGAPPRGTLVYMNSSGLGSWDFDRRVAGRLDTGDVPALARGVSVSPDGWLVLPREIDNDWIGLQTLALDGRTGTGYRIARPLAFYTSPVMFSGDGRRIAFGIDEPVAGSGERRSRVLVYGWPDGTPLAQIEGVDNPEWIHASGELVVRDAETYALRLFDASLRDTGSLAGLVALSFNASFSLSRDGRHVLREDGPRIRVHDRATGRDGVALERISNVHAPRLSPDGTHIAFHAIDLKSASPQFHTYVPHLLPWRPGQTLRADENTPQVGDPLAFTGYTMDWLPAA